MRWPFDFLKTQQLILDLQNQLNAFVIDLAQLKSLREIQNTISFDGSKDLVKINELLDLYLVHSDSSTKQQLELETERLRLRYELRNRQLWVVDKEFVYDEIGEVVKHCLAVQFAMLQFEMPSALRQQTKVVQKEKQMLIFGRHLQFDFRDFAEETLEKAFESFDIVAIELEYGEEKTMVKTALQTLYQNTLYEPGDGVSIQTQIGSYFIHQQSNKNHYLKMRGNQALEWKMCIGPPKASKCKTVAFDLKNKIINENKYINHG